jgi:hypothetical protein
VTSIAASKMATKKPAWNISQAGITFVPGLFSDLFNVAASRPAQITTG